MKARVCKNAEAGTAHARRPAPHPGPLCATCHREASSGSRKARHEARVQRVYGLAPGGYDALLKAQKGRCYICHRRPGKRRSLAVDHNHRTGEVRGLLCTKCNRYLGWILDDPYAAARIAQYLVSPPSRSVL